MRLPLSLTVRFVGCLDGGARVSYASTHVRRRWTTEKRLGAKSRPKEGQKKAKRRLTALSRRRRRWETGPRRLSDSKTGRTECCVAKVTLIILLHVSRVSDPNVLLHALLFFVSLLFGRCLDEAPRLRFIYMETYRAAT